MIMTDTDRRNLTALIRRARRTSDPSPEFAARYAAERYYGLVTCEPYVAGVRTLVDEIDRASR